MNETQRIDVELDGVLDRYTTTEDVARLIGRPVDFVNRMVRRGLAEPALKLGERQFARRDVLRLAFLARMQDALGAASTVPVLAMQHADEAINDLLRDPEQGSVVMMTTEAGVLHFAVSLPPLRDLLKGTAREARRS